MGSEKQKMGPTVKKWKVNTDNMKSTFWHTWRGGKIIYLKLRDEKN
jgi:hypothetical protein